MQCEKLKKEIADLRTLLANKETADLEEVRKATSSLQQSSLKLFELAYKKVCIGLSPFTMQCTNCIFNPFQMSAERESNAGAGSSDSSSSSDTSGEAKKEEKN